VGYVGAPQRIDAKKEGTSLRRNHSLWQHSSLVLDSLVKPPERAHSLDGGAAVAQRLRMVGSHLQAE